MTGSRVVALALFVAVPALTWAATHTGRPELVVVNRTASSVTCQVVAYEKEQQNGSYAGVKVTAAAKGQASTRFDNFDDRGALCYHPDDYKNHPNKQPYTDSVNQAGNLYARTERFGNVGNGKITVTCYSGLSRCTVIRD